MRCAQQIDLPVGDQSGIAWIGQHRIQRLDQPEAPIGLRAAAAPRRHWTHPRPRSRFDFAPIEAWKLNSFCVHFGISEVLSAVWLEHLQH